MTSLFSIGSNKNSSAKKYNTIGVHTHRQQQHPQPPGPALWRKGSQDGSLILAHYFTLHVTHSFSDLLDFFYINKCLVLLLISFLYCMHFVLISQSALDTVPLASNSWKHIDFAFGSNTNSSKSSHCFLYYNILVECNLQAATIFIIISNPDFSFGQDLSNCLRDIRIISHQNYI